MEKNNNIARYKSARYMLAFIAIISVINVYTILSPAGSPLVLTSIIPQISLTNAMAMEGGLAKVILIICGVVLPIAVYAAAYFLSKNQYKWMLPPMVVIAMDSVTLLYILSTIEFSFINVFDCIIEALVIFSLFKGYTCGKQLDNDFTVDKTEKPKIVKKGKVYEFSKELEKQNKTNMFYIFIVAVLVLAAILYFSSKYSISILQQGDEKTGAIIFIASMVVALVAYITIIALALPYVNAANYYYYFYNKVLYRASVNDEKDVTPLQDIQLLKETKKAYHCTYRDEKKTKKIVIPKCYLKIEEIIKK